MAVFWVTLATLVAALALTETFFLGCQSWEHRRRARGRLKQRFLSGPRVPVALFVPCKGIDVGFIDNLRPLFLQEYEDYEILFIVESDDDDACAVINSLIDQYHQVDARLVVAGKADHTCQKVHNLRAAVKSVSPKVQIYAFVDSDARPQAAWLRHLIHRLHRPDIGIVTGYRWFIPQRPTFANWLLYGINATAASLYSPKSLQPVWGGSWAIRREVFERTRLDEQWRGRLTDDLVATNVVQKAKLRIEFEPACMIASPLDVSPRQMFNFLRR
ncbi:MAG: glycosyltransferase, partial [Planctomycetota bacterium]